MVLPKEVYMIPELATMQFVVIYYCLITRLIIVAELHHRSDVINYRAP